MSQFFLLFRYRPGWSVVNPACVDWTDCQHAVSIGACKIGLSNPGLSHGEHEFTVTFRVEADTPAYSLRYVRSDQ